MICSGLYTPLITPFVHNKLDLEGLKKNIQRQKEAKVAGIVALATTSETPTLTEEEKESILQICQDSQMPLIIGCSHSSTEALIQKLPDYKMADALLISPPTYNKPTQEGLYQHFAKISEKTSLPIILYNIPSRTSVNIEPTTIGRLVKIANIIGIKECNILQAVEVIQTNIPLLAGDDAWILPLIALGARGAIAAAANVVPYELNTLVQAALHQDFEKARALHSKLFPLFQAGSWESNPIPYKAAMNLMGLPAGEPRLPLLPFSDLPKLEKVLWTLDS